VTTPPTCPPQRRRLSASARCRRTLALVSFAFVISVFVPHLLHAQNVQSEADSTGISRATAYRAAVYGSAYYAGSLIVLSKTWYRDRDVVPFHFYNDNAAYLQVDKLGHAFGAYVYSYAGYHYLLRSGRSRSEALVFGATLGLVLQAPIEIMDGIHEGYGFSWGDMIANASGSALVLGQELLGRGQVAKPKFSYGESSYARNGHGYLGKSMLDRLFNDYNGHTYWLSLPVDGFWRGDRIPDWLNVAVGYGANGMYGEYENVSMHDGMTIPETARYRQFLLSLDVDWTRIETESRALSALLKAMTFVKLPFPALEYTSTGQLRGHWLYF
jgi:uncharacterized protein YfiM (DUF2279 family)